MQLDTTIEQRLKELEQVNDEIEGARNDINSLEENSQRNQVEMLAAKLEKNKNIFEILKFQTLANGYDLIATNRFPGQLSDDQARNALQDSRT